MTVLFGTVRARFRARLVYPDPQPRDRWRGARRRSSGARVSRGLRAEAPPSPVGRVGGERKRHLVGAKSPDGRAAASPSSDIRARDSRGNSGGLRTGAAASAGMSQARGCGLTRARGRGHTSDVGREGSSGKGARMVTRFRASRCDGGGGRSFPLAPAWGETCRGERGSSRSIDDAHLVGQATDVMREAE